MLIGVTIYPPFKWSKGMSECNYDIFFMPLDRCKKLIVLFRKKSSNFISYLDKKKDYKD